MSEREREVLEAIASGATNREIAGTLFLSPHTVKEHTSTLYRKLGVRNRAEAVQKAQRLGLISYERQLRWVGEAGGARSPQISVVRVARWGVVHLYGAFLPSGSLERRSDGEKCTASGLPLPSPMRS